jgi:hypothetical protein
MKKLFRIVYCFFLVLLIGSCSQNNQRNIENNSDSKLESFQGNYVSSDYQKRNEGYDWVAVKVSELTDSMLHISIRSRADIKKPTCTFDANALKMDSTQNYIANIEGNTVLFIFEADSMVVSADPGNLFSNPNYFCSGGASIAGVYKKIEEPLDSTQIDKVLFRKGLNYKEFSFFIELYGKKLTIQPIGLSIDDHKVIHEIEGTIVNAEVGDLNIDGFPEVLIYLQSDGSGSYGSVIGYSVNNGKSMSSIANLPPVAENAEANSGYMGHDEFAIVESSLIQRFPIYKPGDSNAKPTGGTRQVQYKLKDGEAMRQFVVDQIVEY